MRLEEGLGGFTGKEQKPNCSAPDKNLIDDIDRSVGLGIATVAGRIAVAIVHNSLLLREKIKFFFVFPAFTSLKKNS